MAATNDNDDEPLTEKEFKAIVKDMIRRDDHVKEKTAELKPDRRALKEDKEDIADYMQDHGITEVSVKGGKEKLLLTVRQAKIKPKKPDIIRQMTELFGKQGLGDEAAVDKAIEMYDSIFENPETKEVVTVTRKKVGGAAGGGKKAKRAAAASEDFE